MRVFLTALALVLAVSCGGGGASVGSCGPGAQSSHVCTSCGLAGGCASYADQCAQTCATSGDCASADPLVGCFNGVCQVGGCI